MVRTHTLIALVVSASLLGLGSCKGTHEHDADEHEAHEGHESAEAEEGEHEGHEGMLPAKPAVSLSAAIATAQKSVPDGRVLQAEIESEKGKTICSIVLASGKRVKEVNVDAATGKILATEDEELPPECAKLMGRIGENPKLVGCSTAQAVDAALAKAPGAWALAASLSDEEGKLVYSVFMIDGKTAKLAEVSAADGKVQKVSDLELEEGVEHEGMEELEQPAIGEAPPAKPK
jgi:uncharacterized membrane protein YkoI